MCTCHHLLTETSFEGCHNVCRVSVLVLRGALGRGLQDDQCKSAIAKPMSHCTWNEFLHVFGGHKKSSVCCIMGSRMSSEVQHGMPKAQCLVPWARRRAASPLLHNMDKLSCRPRLLPSIFIFQRIVVFRLSDRTFCTEVGQELTSHHSPEAQF
jgi:hypothetical protein